jgi:hypothetical protein
MVRLRDYETALAFYLPLIGKCIDGIVFCENSNSDVGSLRDLVQRAGVSPQVEFLTFCGTDHPLAFGRGYGEARIIDRVMSDSVLLRDRPNHVIWKVTGRYVIRNMQRLIRRRPLTLDFYCNCRNWRWRCTDMFVLAWSRKGYEAVIKDRADEFRLDVLSPLSPENRLRDLVDRASARLRVVRRFNVTPFVEGTRGWNGTQYHQGRDLLKYYTRAVANWVVPWLWI